MPKINGKVIDEEIISSIIKDIKGKKELGNIEGGFVREFLIKTNNN